MSNQIKVYGRRFCGTCEHHKTLDGGKVKDPRTNRWVCGDCISQEKAAREERKNVQKQEAA